MASTATGYDHIVLTRHGVPVVAGTRMKVSQLVEERMAYGWSPEELQFQHPELTLGQIHSALGYYADHAADVDDEIQRRLEEFDRLHRAAQRSPLAARLRASDRR